MLESFNAIAIWRPRLVGRIPELFSRKADLKELREEHQEILRRLTIGQAPSDIARELGVTIPHISLVRNSTPGVVKLAELRSQADAETVSVSARIQSLGEAAVSTLEELLLDESSSRTLKAKIAMDLLDRAGHGGVQKIQKVETILGPEDLERLKENARAARILVLDPEPRSEASEAATSDGY